jgi:Glycosyltransferase Family 4
VNGDPRILVWSWCDPAFPSGSPAILSELVSHFPLGQVELVCEKVPMAATRELKLPHPVHRLSAHQLWPFRKGSRVRAALRMAGVPILVANGIRWIKAFRPDFLLTVYYDERWILSSYLISRATGVPVLYYVHDPYLEPAVHRGGVSAKLARWLEPASLRHGKLLVLSESLRRFYREKYGIEATVVRHMSGRTRAPRKSGDRGKTRTIGFAGTIYENNRGLIRQLVEAAGQVSMRVTLWTNAKPEALAQEGIAGAHVDVRFEADQDRLTNALAQCDLLYLPLEFKDSARLPTDSLRYAFPTKARDYVLAGPEILVHCPADYDTARFFREHEAAHHLGSDEPGALAAWLERWQRGEQPMLAEAAMQRAAHEFSPAVNLARLRGVFEGHA